jgi:membrane dipeptidase
MLIVDAHEDLAWNMLTFGRDYIRAAEDTRQLEHGADAPRYNGDTLLGWPDYQRGRVAVVFSTLFVAPAHANLGPWDTQYYTNFDQAHALYRAQLDAYHRLANDHPDHFRLILARSDLQEVLSHHQRQDVTEHPVGLAVLMEGAEGVRTPSELDEWWQLGVRLIGLAWRGTRFCGGTLEPGPLTKEGYALLDGMADLGFTLDLSHMDEQSALQALDYYPGRIIASHSNAVALLKDVQVNRFLSDRVIQGLIERGGVIGVVPFNGFLLWGWSPRDGRQAVTLHQVVAQIDYICQMAGDVRHVGLGSDYDGGFGLQSVPSEIDTIADLQKLVPLLAVKGYSEADITAIMGGNWLTLLEQISPEGL